eukprot:c23070_g1_i1.p1 GENE.c23070_g1_i1~~c23070_g1_i1.p1  ORF type:complete len:548 (-),score=189.06 c23070_g1_i1:168-1766(-)
MSHENLNKMNQAHITGYDVVIVCTSNEQQESWWQDRLSYVRGQIIPQHTVVVAVHEDWDDGAGNALGTLYAYQKAVQKAKDTFNFDISARLADKENPVSVALYHTAGKGTRLAPLPGAENNNKPGVKLPAIVQLSHQNKSANMTILEAVIKQTSSYAESRKGRLSVYWGDQVFVPNVTTSYTPSCHADILCQLGPMMTEKEWEERGMDKYGLIAVNKEAKAAQVEKVSHATAEKLLKNFGVIERVGVSMGSFSISHYLLSAFLELHKDELSAKQGKLDADPHWWMPLTLERQAYIDLLEAKGAKTEFAGQHHDRMAAFKDNFISSPEASHALSGLFGAVDVGLGCYWWDYGQLKLYAHNNKLSNTAVSETALSEEAKCMRQFFCLPAPDANGNVCVSSHLGDQSQLKQSVLSNVNVIGKVEVSDSLLVGVTARSVKGSGCVLYNVVDDSEEGIVMEDGGVRADVFFSDGRKVTITTNLANDSGKKWSVKLDGNTMSFEDMYNANLTENVTEAMTKAAEAHRVLAAKHKETHQ